MSKDDPIVATLDRKPNEIILDLVLSKEIHRFAVFIAEQTSSEEK